MVKKTNSWTENFYHNDKGKILGSVSDYNGQHKALLGNFFIGWYISETHARNAVEEAWEFENNKSTKPEPPQNIISHEYELTSNVPRMSGWSEYP